MICRFRLGPFGASAGGVADALARIVPSPLVELRHGEAATAYRQAPELAGNEPERGYLLRRLAEIDGW